MTKKCSAPAWEFNHAPIPRLQSKNCDWWKNKAERHIFTSGSGATSETKAGILSSRNSILKAVQAGLTSSTLICLSGEVNTSIHGGVNEDLSKKRKITDFEFSGFQSGLAFNDSGVPFARCDDESGLNRKRKLAFTASKDGVDYRGKVLTPFSAYSSSILSTDKGYKAFTNEFMPTWVDITNLHEDAPFTTQHYVSLQGPFTSEHVGGLKSRHAWLFSQNDRPESFRLILSSSSPYRVEGIGPRQTNWTSSYNDYSYGQVSTPQGKYSRGMGAKRPVNIANLKTYTGSYSQAEGRRPIGNFTNNYEVVNSTGRQGANIDFVFNNANYQIFELSGAMAASAFVVPPYYRGVSPGGVQIDPRLSSTKAGLTSSWNGGSADYAAPRQISTRRTNQSVITSRFASPGNKYTSKQQFRDISSDELSPNNALPWRNYKIFQSLKGLGAFYSNPCEWGGFQTAPYIYLNTYGPPALQNLNDGADINLALYGRSNWTPRILSGSGEAQPYNKIQRNTLQRIETGINYSIWPFVLGPVTGTVKDNGFVTTPIPRADRTEWFMNFAAGGWNPNYTTFPGALGAVTPTFTYDQYVLSGSRYPQNISRVSSSLVSLPNQAVGNIYPTSALEAKWSGYYIELTDTDGNTVQFEASGLPYAWDDAPTRNSPTSWEYGVGGMTAAWQWGSSFGAAVAAAAVLGDINLTVVDMTGAGLGMYLYQVVPGTDGNTSIGENFPSPTSPATYTNFADGRDAENYNFGSALVSGTAGKNKFIWSNQYGFVPWQQLRAGQNAQGAYLRKNNIYEIPPSLEITSFDRNSVALEGQYHATAGVRTASDRAGRAGTTSGSAANTLTYYLGARFVEPPLTSKFKPMRVNLKTNLGSPSSTRYGQKVSAKMEFSYGNMLCGFANKRLNPILGNPYMFSYNKVKRPYEIMRDHRLNGVLPSADGIQRINMLTYAETIYPKEVYTYLSGTRARLSFVNNFWKSDVSVYHNSNASDLIETGDFASALSQYNQSSNIAGWNRQFNRLQKPDERAGNRIFQTSQGYEIQVSESVPSVTTYSTAEPANASIWPLDSYLYSDYLPAWTGSGGDSLLLADVATMAAGELMMTNFGTTIDQASYGGSAGAPYEPSSIVAAQYVYSIPTEIQNASLKMTATGLAPGGATTRPPWTAGRDRKVVDGTSRGDALPAKEPSYDTYEKYVESVRLSGKENSIVPEYNMSNLVPTYRSSGDPLSYIANSVELTGASPQNYNGSNTNFFTRYSDSDTIEYLKQFTSGRDLEFNKYPKHFQLTSNAILKLLPYDGFFPMNRTLQIATLFSSSYSSNAIYDGEDSSKGPWRSILKPFFAPGILYNSIKSGLAVNHPVRRGPWGGAQFAATDPPQSLKGALSGNLGTTSGVYVSVPGGRRRPKTPSAENFDFTTSNVDKFFWSDSLPFEAILDPEPHLSSTSLRDFLIISDIRNVTKNDISGSISGQVEDSLYKKAISNFMASVPEFFLKKKSTANHTRGYLTKFVSQFGSEDNDEANRKLVSGNKIYMMEVGLMKTDNFNMYNNPYAFGPPTATGSEQGGGWNNGLDGSGAVYSVGKSIPSGSAWPKHRGEFAPFTPPYYYGPSVARFFYAPSQDKNVSLGDILTSTGQNNPELFVQFRNESGSFYDYSSGSFTSFDDTELTLTNSPMYEWNRAWQNRMDIDASITLDNKFKIDNGTYTSKNPNQWVIMPKWECPILDFPSQDGSYDFSGSVDTTNSTLSLNFDKKTYGMWHQYGMTPTDNEGVYLYIKDYTSLLTEPEYILVGDPNPSSGAGEGYYTYAKKIPWPVQEAINNGKELASLADLVGFAPEEVMSSGIDMSKAKRLGELATGGEKSISEAIMALPFYYDEQNRPRLVTLRGSGHDLGPKIRKFRRAFTKYSLPPPLATKLAALVPTNYPNDNGLINPFSDDDNYSNILMNSDPTAVPVVYLFEHQIKLSKQDLADIWQGILPEIGTNMKRNVVAIDHYMPGRATGEDELAYPELLQKEIESGVQSPDGLPKLDLMDTITEESGNGFCPEIRWIVFKVKQKGYSNYSALIANEIDGVDNRLLDTIQRHPANPPERQNYFFTNSVFNPTYNWPYDYMSLVETANLEAKIGFRPELAEELADYQVQQEPPRLPQDIRITGVTLPPNADLLMTSPSVGTLAENLNDITYVPRAGGGQGFSVSPSLGQPSPPMVVRNSAANVSMPGDSRPGGGNERNVSMGGGSVQMPGFDKGNFRYGGAANVSMGGYGKDWWRKS